ncbi:MAG: nicotinate (nicotinamide) nucleotide adenylyltransferase [Candidatus Norongarragalinales archaeon]
MKRIAILGGSFNPPHYGHLTVAKGVLENFDCDEVWLMPCFKQAEGKKIEKAKHRLAMVRLALKNAGLSKRIKTSGFEMKLRRKNYTADTVEKLQKRFPSTQFYWIFGSELVKDFPKWGKWEKLRKLLPLVIYPRPGFKKPSRKFSSSLGAKLVFLPHSVRKSKVSSTQARAFASVASPKLKMLVPRNVFNYIKKHGLYGWKGK